jgi:hypothetical protein
MRLFLMGCWLAGCSLINEKVFDPQDLAVCVDNCGDLSQAHDLAGGDGKHDSGMQIDGALDFSSPDLKPMCASADDCTDPTAPICAGDGGTCRACVNSSDDSQCAVHSATKLCLTEGTNAGKCGDCRPASGTQSGNCAAATPVCDVGGDCRKCAAHSECTSKVCLSDGTCASMSNVLYVNNLNGTCSETGQNGLTPGTAFCSIKDAMGVLSSTRDIVRIFGSTAEYTQLSTVDVAASPIPNFSVFGEGPSASPRSQIYDASKNGVKVAITTGSLTVSIDGLVVGDDTTTSTIDGVLCSNAGTTLNMTVTRTIVQKSGMAGVNSTSCNITLDRDLVSGSGGSGVSATSSQYSITNCFIQKGLSALQAAVSLDPGGSDAMHVFQHNTVVDNTNTGGIGGINVKSGTAKIENSIIRGNSQVTNTQMSGSATFNATFVDIDDTSTPSGTGNVNLPPDFVNATTGPNFDFHLNGRTTANNMCCTDKIASSPVDHDYDGRARPQPAAGMFDIGAHEVP